LVVGGVAVNLHGYNRVTGDLDLIIDLSEHNILSFIEIVKKLNFKPKLPVKLEEFCDDKKRLDWINNKNMKVFTVYNPKDEFENIDVIVENYIDFNSAYKHKQDIKNGSISISVISIDDLIKLKRISNRSRDQIDIAALLEIKKIRKNE
jgi:hypothetical protein